MQHFSLLPQVEASLMESNCSTCNATTAMAEVTLNVNIGGTWEGGFRADKTSLPNLPIVQDGMRKNMLLTGHVAYYGLATSKDESPPFEVPLRKGHGVFHAGLELHKARHLRDAARHVQQFCNKAELRCSGAPDYGRNTAQPDPVVPVERNQAHGRLCSDWRSRVAELSLPSSQQRNDMCPMCFQQPQVAGAHGSLQVQS